MKNKNRFKLVKKAVSSTLILASLTSFTGCVKEIDCSINVEHVHLYLNNNTKLSRYIESEKEYVGNLYRTEDYLTMTDELNIISDNGLYIVEDNIEYITHKLSENQPTRQSYTYDYIYGTYYGYGYGYNMHNGKYEYHYGLQTGWHYGYDWKEISLDEYTNDKVRDITYKYRFYKINEDGTVFSCLFDSLEEVPVEYKYFKADQLVQQIISDEYYLEKENSKTN